MLAKFTELGFSIEITQDGSPTLRLQNQGESMHHSGGAAAETQYIYGDVIQRVHQILSDSCKTCVVGLGLGYIEIAWALSLIRLQKSPSQNISFHSYEVIPGLIQNFKNWLQSNESDSVYDLIVQKLDPKVELTEVKKILQLALQSGSSIEGDFANLKNHRHQYNLICYDAFSQKTSQELWLKEFLQNFLSQVASDECVLTTYACTGELKRALTARGFHFMKRTGFSGKRDSSLAFRGFSLEPLKTISQTSSYNQ